jgi:hypothetical protein
MATEAGILSDRTTTDTEYDVHHANRVRRRRNPLLDTEKCFQTKP